MKKGFTLIELLIATAIFSIVTGGGIASYNQFNQREKLQAAALEVKTYLRNAQTNALSGVKDDTACGIEALDGWCVDLFRGHTYGHCGGPAIPPPPPPGLADFDTSSFSLPEGVFISFDPPQGGIILFKPLSRGLEFSPGVGDTLTICLSTTSFGTNYQYKITVTVSGEITDEGFVSSCP